MGAKANVRSPTRYVPAGLLKIGPTSSVSAPVEQLKVFESPQHVPVTVPPPSVEPCIALLPGKSTSHAATHVYVGALVFHRGSADVPLKLPTRTGGGGGGGDSGGGGLGGGGSTAKRARSSRHTSQQRGVLSSIRQAQSSAYRIRGWFEGEGVSTSRVSPPGPLSISYGHVGCVKARACPPPV
jgi:hypothetical protein